MSDADPTQPPGDLEERAVLAFLEAFAADRLSNGVRTADDYAQLQPAFAARIRREYAFLAEGGAAGAPPAGALDGRRLGPFRLVRELGRGGQAIVYLAEDTRLPRLVALKVLEPSWHSGLGQRAQRFQREAAVLARIHHPGICDVLDVGAARDDGGRELAYIAMRYVEGRTLAGVLASDPRGVGAPSRAAEVVESAARALQAAHEAGVLHRDLKPANIIITPAGAAVLLDFGLAHDEHGDGVTLTSVGDVLGTPAYMAPEQIDPTFGPVDARTDVWALGVVLWECLAGARPFDGPTRDAVARAITDDEPPPLRTGRDGVPRDLAIIAATALSKDRARRYRTAADLAEDLRRFRAVEPILARPASTWTKLARWARRRPATAASLAAVLFLLALTAGVTSWLLAQTRAALDDVGRLADARIVRELRDAAEHLYPSVPESIGGEAGMDRWLARARDVLSRAERHRATLRSLQEKKHSAAGDAAGANTLAWWTEQQVQLVAELEAFVQLVDRVERRRAFASTVDRRTILEYASAWERAAASVRADKRFAGFALRPQRGLVPLGPDPASKLEEFALLESGELPARGAGGALAIAPESALVLVLVPGGAVRIGVDAPSASRPAGSAHVDAMVRDWEGPSQIVDLAPFFISKYEMPQGAWRRASPEPRPAGYVDAHAAADAHLSFPEDQISWEDCARVLPRWGLELPTEAQWERAARGGTTTVWWSGDAAASLAGGENLADRYAKAHGGDSTWRYDFDFDDGYTGSAPVGSFRANGFGLHDIAGNLSEWTRDTWEDYAVVPARPGDGFRAGSNEYRVFRGSNFADSTVNARTGRRGVGPPSVRTLTIGVRPVRAVQIQQRGE